MRLPAGTRIRSLSLHATYACGHSGACCTSGWPIPVERNTYAGLRACLADARLVVAGGAPPLLLHQDAPPETPATTGVDETGACAFYERGLRRCAIHRQLGADALPVACRQFPRVSLLDERGLCVNLSHYCPTAARQLFRVDVPLEIVAAPSAFPADFPFDPLDARGALPPLLKPGVLTDFETFSRWERAAVAVLARDERAEYAVDEISRLTEDLRRWAPGDGPLGAHFDQILAGAGRAGGAGLPRRSSARKGEASRSRAKAPAVSEGDGGPGAPAQDAARMLRHYRLVLDAIPADLRPAVSMDSVEQAYRRWVEQRWSDFAPVVRRYLAAKVFGSWLAYQGGGLRTIVHSLAVALSVVTANAALVCRKADRALYDELLLNAIRRTDELLVHLVSRQDLANKLSAVERVDGALSSDVP